MNKERVGREGEGREGETVGKDNHRLKMRYNEKKSTKRKEEKISKEHNWREEKVGKKENRKKDSIPR